MAGEWFPVDVNLADKPEVLELCEITGLDVEVVVFRLFRLWGWFPVVTLSFGKLSQLWVGLRKLSTASGCQSGQSGFQIQQKAKNGLHLGKNITEAE